MKQNLDTVILFYPRAFPVGHRSRIPFALLYLERMIRNLDLNIVIIDEHVEPNYQHIISDVASRILAVGVSCMTGLQIRHAIDFSQSVRKTAPHAKIIWGGWHPTLLPEQTLKEPFIDYVIKGQGELPFRDLITSILSGKESRELPGVWCKTDQGICYNDPSPCQNMFAWPKVDFSLIDLTHYIFSSSYSERSIGYFTSHGCPFDCTFCCVSSIYERKWFRNNVSSIIDDLKYLTAHAKIDSVIFDDDNFFVNRSFALEFSHALIDSGLDLKWDTSAHAATFLKHFSAKDVLLFYQAGCRQIYVGAESGDQDVLDLLCKNAKVEDNDRFVELLHKYNIRVILSTMVGLPVNCGADADETINMIRRIKLIDDTVRARIFFYTPYPGTPLYEYAIAKGFSPPRELAGWAIHTLRKFSPTWIEDENVRFKLECFANFWLPLYDRNYWRMVPARHLRGFVWVINKLFGPIARWRFRHNFLKWPIEAMAFLALLRSFNRLTGNQFCLGYESYYD